VSYLHVIGVPIFTLISIAYTYWDELYRRVGFLVLDRRIKEYKKLTGSVKKLVPEIVVKMQKNKDHAIEVNHNVVVCQIKISNY
jgi:hypothetical protein